jgi:hypothetical membrane protein
MTRREWLGALAWIVTLQFFVAQGVVQTAWTTPFSLAHNMISDLARVTCGPLHRAPGIDVACSPWHAVMNVSIILNGILIAAGADLTRKAWPATRWMAAALVMVGLTAPGHVLVGLFPSDTAPASHMLGAGLILAFGNPGIVVAGTALWRSQRALAIASLLLGLGGMAGTLLFLYSIDMGIGLGGMERVAFYPLPLWCGVMGAALLRARR